MAKESKKKSPPAKATTNPPPSSLHPPYFQMISEAISLLKDRTGSSQPAIAKFIEEKYQSQLPPNFKKTLSVQVKKFVKSEKLVKVKNSYKLPASSSSAKVNSKANGVKPKAAVTVLAAAVSVPKKVARKVVEKAVKTKRLSQVKTPEALKRKTVVSSGKKSGQKVKSPEAAKKMKKATPVKRVTKNVKSKK